MASGVSLCARGACVRFAASIIGFLTCCLVGLDSTRLSWTKFIKETEGRWSALALDQRGCGESPLGKEREYSAAIVAADIERALQEEVGARKVVLVGHSMGGKVAIQFAADYPERYPAMQKIRVVSMDVELMASGDTFALLSLAG